MYGPSDCKFGRLVCNPTDSNAPTFVVYGAWVYPCRSLKNPVNVGACNSTHGHGVDGWHTIATASGAMSMAGMNHGRRLSGMAALLYKEDAKVGGGLTAALAKEHA